MTSFNISIGGWELPKLDRMAGPADLAKAVISMAVGLGQAEELQLNTTSLDALVELAFYASMAAEEGRFPTFRLFIPAKSGQSPQLFAPLNVVVPSGASGVSVLKRLAPAAGSLHHTLIMENRAGDWVCTGVASFSPPYSSITVGRSEWHLLASAGVWGTQIRVDGPGRLRVDFGYSTICLVSGRLLINARLMTVPAIRNLTIRIGDALTSDLEVHRYMTNTGQTAQNSLPVAHLLEHIVANMQAAGFGGTLIFPGPSVGAAIDPKHETNAIGLAQGLRSFHLASKACYVATSVDEIRQSFAAWQAAVMSTQRAADAVAMMSRIDGCVIMNHEFAVTSFGSKIRLEALKDRVQLPKVHPLRHEPEDDADVRKLGTRNQSAFDLCRSVPHSTAIVVSQDGDVRVTASDDKGVTFLENIEASSLDRPSW